ncbi:MAG: transporter, family, glucarate transporter [Pseudonocardiales bacterium]|nr:transporter, family, glucarate transporter [Pseudonocardiales bacterium]
MSSLGFAVSVRQPYRWVVLTLSSWGPASVAVGKHLGVSLAGLGIFNWAAQPCRWCSARSSQRRTHSSPRSRRSPPDRGSARC